MSLHHKDSGQQAEHEMTVDTVFSFKVIGIQPLAPVQNSVSFKLMQRKTLNFVINLPDVENITK